MSTCADWIDQYEKIFDPEILHTWNIKGTVMLYSNFNGLEALLESFILKDILTFISHIAAQHNYGIWLFKLWPFSSKKSSLFHLSLLIKSHLLNRQPELVITIWLWCQPLCKSWSQGHQMKTVLRLENYDLSCFSWRSTPFSVQNIK